MGNNLFAYIGLNNNNKTPHLTRKNKNIPITFITTRKI